MRAHLLQLDLVWEDHNANYRLAERALDTASPDPGDLVVLPELFDTGFSFRTEKNADTQDRTLRFLLGLADDLGVTIQGSRTLRPCDCDKAFNAATVVAPSRCAMALRLSCCFARSSLSALVSSACLRSISSIFAARCCTAPSTAREWVAAAAAAGDVLPLRCQCAVQWSRAAFATGRSVHETACWDNAQAYDGSIPGWAQYLRDAGRSVEADGEEEE